MNQKLKFGLFAGLTAMAYFLYRNYPKLDILTGFAAKNVCSCTFLGGRIQSSIEAGENGFFPVKYAENIIDPEERSVTSSIFGLKPRKAVFKEGVGCILLPENIDVSKLNFPKPKRSSVAEEIPFPFGNVEPEKSISEAINSEKLEKAVSNAFDPEGTPEKRTRAVLVLHKNNLVAEKYASGFSAETKFLGWSMTKSLVNAVLGVMEKQGIISLYQDHLFEEWKSDERAKIRVNDLLQMNSGLAWNEDYTTVSDVNRMLFLEKEMAQVQLHKKLKEKIGNSWVYASGTTNLLSKFIRDQFQSHQEYLDFWYTEVIDKIGMNSMIVETDAVGNFVGSSYGFAKARDWAKFGLLYLNKGNWNGEQILARAG